MSKEVVDILNAKFNSFFAKEGNVADVINLLGKRERQYLSKKLHAAIVDSDQLEIEDKLKLKIEAVNSLLLFIVERPQLNEFKQDSKSSKSILIQLYELLFELSRTQLEIFKEDSVEKFNYLMLSAIAGICADRTPEVAILIKNNCNWIDRLIQENPELKLYLLTFRFNLDLYGGISKREHIDSLNASEESAYKALEDYQVSEAENGFVNIENSFLIGSLGNFLHVLKNVKEYLLRGKTSAGDSIKSIIDTYIYNALTLSKNLEHEFLSTFIHHSKSALDQLCRNSIWQLADRSPLIRHFFEKSINDGEHLLLTLLPSQRKTIYEVLTAKKSVVVNMPTSSGKSLLAELYILHTIQSHSFGGVEPTIAYIVPTNALINQVKYKLRRLFGDTYHIESVLPYYEEDSLEEEILSHYNHLHVIVTTPEKLDFLIRNERPAIRNLKAVILDEAHNLSDKTRGSKFELLLSVIKQKRNDVNFLLLSPFITNAKQIAEWLGDSSENSIDVSISWAPTKQYIGCNIFNDRKTESLVTYFPTARNTIVEDEIDIPLSINPNEVKKELNLTKIDYKVKNIGLLKRYINLGESTLVFCSGPSSAQKMAEVAKDYFVKNGSLQDRSHIPEIDRLLTLIKFESKEDDPLIDCIKYGVAYHHSQLSSTIKEEIEKLIAGGHIKLICATPTLAQGMNFPITTVIFETTKLGGNGGDEMSSSVFWNIAGRAGRAFMDSEGHVIVGFSKSTQHTKNKTLGYIKDDIKEIISSLSDFFRSMDGEIDFNYQLVKNNPAISNFLQYLNHIIKVAYNYKLDTLDISRIRSMLNNSLFYRQINFEQGFLETQKKVSDFATGYINHLKGQNINQLSLADVFGISNISLNSVSARVIEHKQKIEAEFSPSEYESHLHASKIILGTKNEQDLADIITILSRIPELKVAMREEHGHLDTLAIAKVLIGWVNGENVQKIAKDTQKQGETEAQAIGICNKYINGNLRNYLPWGLNIYQTLTNDSKTDAAKMLPSFVYYGVNNKESVILANIGIPRFIIPQVKEKLASIFHDPLTIDNMEKVKKALRTIEDFGVGGTREEKTRIKEIIQSYVA